MCFTYTGSPVRTRVEPFLYSDEEEEEESLQREEGRKERKGKELIDMNEGSMWMGKFYFVNGEEKKGKREEGTNLVTK